MKPRHDPVEADEAAPALLSFTGWAARFDQVDRAGDVIRRGAFGGLGMVPLLWNHRGPPVGAVAWCEQPEGLYVMGETNDPGIAELVHKGAVDGLSIGFRAKRIRQGAWREILHAALVEISLVAQPMQAGARIDHYRRE